MTRQEALTVLKEGLKNISSVRPVGIQEPVRQVLRAAIEHVQRTPHSILGLPINYALEIARELKKESGE